MGDRPLCLECEADATHGRNAEGAKGKSAPPCGKVQGRRKTAESRRRPVNRLLKKCSFSTASLERPPERQEHFLTWTGIRPRAYRSPSILAVLLSSQGKRR